MSDNIIVPIVKRAGVVYIEISKFRISGVELPERCRTQRLVTLDLMGLLVRRDRFEWLRTEKIAVRTNGLGVSLSSFTCFCVHKFDQMDEECPH